ncbi:MAG: hypothetical protein ACLP9L_12555 [Thermoguttaceae bacterium]
MITITRRLALQLRTVLRRAFGNFRGKGPAIGFIANAEGLTAKSMFGDVAIECRIPGDHTAETIWLPFEFLADVEGKKDEPVDLEATGNGQVSVQWRTGNVPQIVNYDGKQPFEADKFPASPTAFTANRPGLLQALHEASEVADADAVRYAINCLQLCPDGTINATDGRQLLIRSGFTFPWQEAVLVPRNKVFASPELPQDQPVAVAQSGEWAVVSVGRWTIYLRINTGRYPNMSRYNLDPDTATTRCQFSKDDIRFLAKTLPQLPSDEENNFPLTIDLNGQVAVRAKAADQAKPTELVLTNSRCTGEPIRVNINRMYLQRAMKLGVHDLCLYGVESPLVGFDDERKYIWMPLDAESAIPPADDAIRIESPEGEIAAIVTHPPTPRKAPPMSESTNTNGHAATNGQTKTDTTNPKASRRKASQQDITGLIDQAVQFRTALHNLVQQSNGLVKALKQHRRQSRAIQNTLASLKQLKTLGV